MFDVSHLGTVRAEGPAALAALQGAFTNDLEKIGPGRAQYTHLLGEDGSVLDDIIVWWVDDDVFDVMPNASNTERVVAALRAGTGAGSEAVDRGLHLTETTPTRAILAVQGPDARTAVNKVSAEAAEVGRFRVQRFMWRGHECVAAGTGYTGEDGLECAVPSDTAAEFWSEIVTAGAVPAGLGARDTLRLEAGLPLHGHELGEGISPLDAGLGWVVAWDKGDFPGREALVAQRDRGVDRVLRGIRTQGRRPPREGQIVAVEGRDVGAVTSGNFSPVLECGIAMAFVEPSVIIGDEVMIQARGSELVGRVVEMPFVG
jgi:aminomethyltransferase